MKILLGIYLIDEEKVTEYLQKPVRKEKEIEKFIEDHPKVLDKDLFIIGSQVITDTGVIVDLMGLDKGGGVAIIEIKKGIPNRETVSQILEYAVWAEELQYEKLNEIATTKYHVGFQNLHEKYVKDFNVKPDSFNQDQRLYIVAEKIDDKTENVCRYLQQRGIDIRCIEMNFYEKDNRKLVETRTIVGAEGADSEPPITWPDKLQLATEENRKNVTDLIEKIKTSFDCTGMPRNRYYYIYNSKGVGKRNSLFGVILCGKKTAHVRFRADSTFDYLEQQMRKLNGWFFVNTKYDEIRIDIIPDNFDLILSCLKHSYNTTLDII